jgi:hypothetical protein
VLEAEVELPVLVFAQGIDEARCQVDHPSRSFCLRQAIRHRLPPIFAYRRSRSAVVLFFSCL